VPKVKISSNWIREIYFDPCDPDPWIYLELAFPALIQALWEYVQWDWEDYIEHTTGKPWQKHARNHIRNGHWQPPKAISRGVSFLFIAEAGIQRLGWMFMVAEIVANAFVRWSSLVLSLPQCNEEYASGYGRGSEPLDGRPLTHDWMTGPSWVCEAGDMFPYIGARWIVEAGGAVYYTTFQRYANFFSGEELIVNTRIIRLSDGKVMAEGEPNVPSDPNKRSASMHGKIRNTSEVNVEYEFQVRLADGQSPLIWHCIGDFVSVRFFGKKDKTPKIYLPYISTPQPSRRTAKPRKPMVTS
jgi:hypothetical protein